jgi:single-strand DNA-binding protein
MSFNLAIVEGHLAKDPEIKQTSGGKSVVNFTMGSDYGWGDNKATQWDNIVCWGDLADKVGKFCKKGSGVLVVGERRTRSWDDKATGAKKYITEIHADKVQFLEKGSGEKSSGSRQSAPASRPAAAPVARPTTTNDDPFGDDQPF